MKTLLLALVALTLGCSAKAQTVIYDTFNENDQANLFDCCNVLALHGNPDANRIAIPFVPSTTNGINRIDLALSFDSGKQPQELQVRIYGSTAGMPGKLKKQFSVKAVPNGGQCCEYVTIIPHANIKVHAGGRYWIEVNAIHHDRGGWNLNTVGDAGDYATQQGQFARWLPASGPLPAIRLYGAK